MPGTLQTSTFSLVNRALPAPTADGVERETRVTRYGSVYCENVVPTKHNLGDEGSYFIANNGTSAVTGQTDITFTNTHPTIAILNNDSAGNASAKRIYIDYIYLITGGTAFINQTGSAIATFVAVIIDNVVPTFSTSGTLLTPVLANQDSGTKSIATVRVGALTIAAPSANSRTVVGQRLVRCPATVSAFTLINLDQFLFNFGGVDVFMALPNAGSATLEGNVVGRTLNLPPIVIGPQQAAYIYIFNSALSSTITAGNYIPEIGWFER